MSGKQRVWNPHRDVPGELDEWLQDEVASAVTSYVADGLMMLACNEDGDGAWRVVFLAAEPMDDVERQEEFGAWLLEQISQCMPAAPGDVRRLREILTAALALLDEPS